MVIFVVVGMPASGKNLARMYATDQNLPYFATGDVVREHLTKSSLEATPENTGRVSTELRGQDGMGVTRSVLAKALECRSNVVFLEGMRSWPEIELIKAQARCFVVAFLAPRELRKTRVISRGRPDDSAQAFSARDTRELEYGAAVPIALADEYVLNTGSMEESLSTLHAIIQRHAFT
jgi:dephospho-CoA kinase